MLIPSQYYRQNLKRLYKFVVPKNNSVLHINKSVYEAKGKYDYIIIDDLVGDLFDIQLFLQNLKRHCHDKTRVVTTYYNHLWEPLLKFASYLGIRAKTKEQNWLNDKDIANLFNLAGFETIIQQKRVLLPLDIPLVSDLTNKWLAHIPIVNNFCLTTWSVARLRPATRREYTVSIVIPARNEAGNINRAIKELPKFGKTQEVIFVEGHSRDNTWEVIQSVVEKNKNKKVNVKAYRQKGIGKADAVRLGFAKATGEMLMILDADLTVDPAELPKFYEAIATGEGEYINGSRLVYPMEKQAMRSLNKLGNRVFSWLFTWILGQRIKDTLCGTKVLLKTDYEKIVKNRSFFGDFDPFGDYDLIFGSIKQNLKMVEIPIRYKERVYGSTNISRFRHGLLLLQMTWIGLKRFRVW